MDYKALILDQVIFQAFQNDDEAAFRTIYTTFRRPIYITTRKIVQSSEDAEDITAQAFMLVWERRKSIESIRHLNNLLFIIARNMSISLLRKRSNRLVELNEDILENFDDSNTPQYFRDELFADLVEKIIKIIELMPNLRGEVFRLRYLNNKSVEEVASELNLTVQSVYKHTTRAIGQVRTSLAESQLHSSKLVLLAILLSSFDLISTSF